MECGVTIWTIVLFSNDFNGHADKWTLASYNSNCSHTMAYVLEDSYATIKFPNSMKLKLLNSDGSQLMTVLPD